MTREEAIKILQNIYFEVPEIKEALQIAIEALIPELRESEDERIRKFLIDYFEVIKSTLDDDGMWKDFQIDNILTFLEKQKDASKAIETVDRIDKYIDEHLANAHDMKDSNPDKKYYRGWDDALGEMARILQDVYSEEKQKEQKPVTKFKVGDKVHFKGDNAILTITEIHADTYYADSAYGPIRFSDQDECEIVEQKPVNDKDFKDNTVNVEMVTDPKTGEKYPFVSYKDQLQKPTEWNPTNEDVILFNKAVTTNTTLTPDERAKLDIIRMKFKHRPVIKQQEQKPVQTAKDAWKEMRLEVYAQASGNRHEPNYSDDSTKMFSLCDIDEIFEKIGNYTVEQKPAWSEEDERMLRRCIKSIESSKNFAETQTFKEAKDKEKEWLILLPEKFNQYPIEDCDYGLEIALDILVKTLNKVQGYQTDDGIREHQTAIQAVKDAMKPWSYPYGKNETVDKLIAIAECLEMDGDCMFNGISGDDCGKFLRDLARKEVE